MKRGEKDFSETFWANSSGGFEGSQTFFEKIPFGRIILLFLRKFRILPCFTYLHESNSIFRARARLDAVCMLLFRVWFRLVKSEPSVNLYLFSWALAQMERP